jgi:hypothetical protein
MEWRVVKTGAQLFDLLHTYGLGLLLAYGCELPVEVSDTGCTYSLTCGAVAAPAGSPAILDEVLTLPAPQEVEAACLPEAGLPVANLDGLLTVLFTTPGSVRALSVADLARKRRRDDSAAGRAITKARAALARWKGLASKESLAGAVSWLERVLQDYTPGAPAMPVPASATDTRRDLSLVMMIDPSFSYSTRRPRSDGLVSQKTQVAIRGTNFAVLLACIGAARFLRAQRMSGDLVNCYVPQAQWIMLAHDTRLPLLAPVEAEAHQALLVQWLTYATSVPGVRARWKGLAYHTIQTQGTQQSIPRDNGCLDLTWLSLLPAQERDQLRSFWRMLFSSEAGRRACEIDMLIDALRARSQNSWAAHLLEMARRVHHAKDAIRPYRLAEVKEVTTYMDPSTPSLLRKILEQKAGTLRFGHALRLLGQANPASVRDLVEEFESVQTLDQLIHTLALTAQECQVASAKSQFLVVPSDGDLALLLEDVKQASPRTIAGFLVLLSALRYPRLEETEQDASQLRRLLFLLIATLASPVPERVETQDGAGEGGDRTITMTENPTPQQGDDHD